MEILSLAELGAQVVLDAILLWLVMKYLPSRDKVFTQELRTHTEEMKKHTAQLNRLVNAFVLSLDEDSRKRHQVGDDIFRSQSAPPQPPSQTAADYLLTQPQSRRQDDGDD